MLKSDRRHFLVFLGLAVAGCRDGLDNVETRATRVSAQSSPFEPAATPELRSCPAPETPIVVPDRSTTTLEHAWQLARERGRPLLVVFGWAGFRSRPTQEEELLGSLIEHGADECVAALHGFELAAADHAAVERMVGIACTTDTRLALLESTPDGPRVRVPAEPMPLPSRPAAAPGRHEFDTASWEAEFVRIESERHAAFVASIRSLSSTDALAAELAAFEGDPDGRSRRVAELAREVRERWTNTPPVGAHWGRDNGCAVELEGVALAVGCGMGSVSRPSRRFLMYYAEG